MRHVNFIFVVFVFIVGNHLRSAFTWPSDLATEAAAAAIDTPHAQSGYRDNEHLFGFFYQCYRQPKATFEVVRSVKERMPEAPIYMVSSAGYNYQPLADRYSPNVKFVYSTENVSPKQKSGVIWTYFDRMRDASLWCNCTYLVILEDDTYLKKPLSAAPPNDAGGVQSSLWNGIWDVQLLSRYAQPGGWSYLSHGLCGGSYVRTAAFLDSYGRVNRARLVHMSTLDGASTSQTGAVTKTIPSEFIGMKNDVTLAVMMMDANYSLLPWDELAEMGKPNQNPNASIVHGDKHFYGVPLNAEDGKVTLPGFGKRKAQISIKTNRAQ